jgi:3-methyladenine DNA glycosylase AlkD
VQKGVSWLLKEAYPARPREVVEFLKRRRDWPRLVLRYAAEKMTAQDKARIL